MRSRVVLYVLLLLLGPIYIWAHVIDSRLSGDVFWQLAAGQKMLQQGHVLHFDPFSWTRYEKPWVAEEWGFEVLLALLRGGIGPWAFWIISAGVATLAVFSVVARLREMGHSWEKTALLVALMSLAFPIFIKVRPQVFSYAFTGWELYFLTRSRRQPKILWILPPLLWIWTNLHGSFLLGFLLLGFEFLWTVRPVRFGLFYTPESVVAPRQLLGVGFVAAVLSFVNPNGPGLWAYAWHVSFSPVISQIIMEWQSPNFHNGVMLAAVVGPLAALILLMAGRRSSVPWPEVVLTGGFFVATLRATRFLPYYLLEWPILVAELSGPLEFRRLKPLVVAPVIAALEVVLLLLHPAYAPGTISLQEPKAAVTYLQRHHATRVLNAYHWGGYLIYRHVPVFVDARTDFYLPSHVLQNYLAVKNLSQDPNQVMAQYRVNYVLWPPHQALDQFLLADRRSWRVVFDSPAAVVYQHRGTWGMRIYTHSVPSHGRQTS